MCNIFFEKGIDFMKVTTEMYTKLFNELTNIQEELQKIIERAKAVQAEVEEIYINLEEE